MAGSEPSRFASRVFEVCIGILLAAMALYAAVEIIRSIWLFLCIGALVVTVIYVIFAVLHRRSRGW